MDTKMEERYSQVCFSLQEKQIELEKIKTDIFTLNPEIQKLVEEIKFLTKEKKELEEQINE